MEPSSQPVSRPWRGRALVFGPWTQKDAQSDTVRSPRLQAMISSEKGRSQVRVMGLLRLPSDLEGLADQAGSGARRRKKGIAVCFSGSLRPPPPSKARHHLCFVLL